MSACGAFPASLCAPWVEVWRSEPLAPDRGAQRLARKALALFSLKKPIGRKIMFNFVNAALIGMEGLPSPKPELPAAA